MPSPRHPTSSPSPPPSPRGHFECLARVWSAARELNFFRGGESTEMHENKGFCAIRALRLRKPHLRRGSTFCYDNVINPPGSAEAEQGLSRKVGALAFYYGMKNTIVYIDGYNLYYGLLKGTPYKWLDLERFSKELVGPGHNVVAVKYFTSLVRPHPYDVAAVERQNVYLQAIQSAAKVVTTLGFYSKRKKLLPAVEETCRVCATAEAGLVRVVVLEEKRTDVNMAVSIVVDAAKPEVDCVAVVTGDSDQAGAIEAARYTYAKKALVFNPHEAYSVNLKNAASYYQNIPRDLPARCQLPDAIPVGSHGNFIRRPAAWQ